MKRPCEIELEPGRGYGQNKLYRYKDPSFTIANTIYHTHLKDIPSMDDQNKFVAIAEQADKSELAQVIVSARTY